MAKLKEQIFLLSVTVIHVEGLDKMDKTPAAIMEELLEQHQVPKTTLQDKTARAQHQFVSTF